VYTCRGRKVRVILCERRDFEWPQHVLNHLSRWESLTEKELFELLHGVRMANRARAKLDGEERNHDGLKVEPRKKETPGEETIRMQRSKQKQAHNWCK